MKLGVFSVGRGGREYTHGGTSVDKEGEVVGGIMYVKWTTGGKAGGTCRCQCLAC